MKPSAPAARALSMYRLPSVEPPFIATKTEPGLMRRESYSMPVMGSEESPDAPTAVISAARSFQFMSEVIVDCWDGQVVAAAKSTGMAPFIRELKKLCSSVRACEGTIGDEECVPCSAHEEQILPDVFDLLHLGPRIVCLYSSNF